MTTCAGSGCCNLLKPNPRGRQPMWCSGACRKTQYAGVCVDCGGPTEGSEGRGPRQPKRCRTCVALDPEVVAATVRMWAEGRPVPEIASAFGLTPKAAINRIKHLRERGVDVPRRRGRVDRATVERLWAEGATSREIAAAIGWEVQSVWSAVATWRRKGWDLPVRAAA